VLIVGTLCLDWERERDTRLGVDAYEYQDRVDLVLCRDGKRQAEGERIALTLAEAEKLEGYLRLVRERRNRAVDEGVDLANADARAIREAGR